MFHSRLIRPSARCVGQVPWTWSRLFHIRKTLCSTFKPGNDPPQGLDEQKNNLDASDSDRPFKRQEGKYIGYKKGAKQSDDRQYYAKQSDDRQYYAKQSDDRQYYAKQRDDRQYYAKQSDDRQYYAKQSDDRQYYDKKKYNVEYLTRKGKGYKTRAFPKDEFIAGGESEEFRRDSRMSDRYTPKWQMSERYRERANHQDEFIKDQESEEFTRDPRMSNRYTPKWQMSERYRERANHRDEFIKDQESEEFTRDPRMSNRYTPKWQMSERYRERANHRDEFIMDQESEEFRRDPRMSSRYTPKWQMSERYRERANHRDESPDEDVSFLGHKHRFKGDKPRSEFGKTNLPRDWSESFGTLSVTRDPTLQDVLFSKDTLERRDDAEDEVVDSEDLYDSDDEGHTVKRHIPLSRTNRRHIPNWYGRRIEKLGKKGLVKEAIEVFDKWMIEQDRVKPTIFEYGVMISLLGRAGYTHKAFQLHKQIANMNLVVDAKIYSSLFNACAKSPFKEDALQRATKLRYLMIEKGFEPPLITYQAMINAFGMCGDTEMAFSLLDEALQKYRPSSNLLAVCLVACISDKEAGFRHAVQVWRKFMKLRLRPCITCYNLLLRAVKECGVGPQTPDNNLLLIETAGELDSVATKRNDRKKIVSSLQLRADHNKPNSPSVVEVIEGVSPVDKPKFHGKKTHEMELKGSDTVNGSKHRDTNAKLHEKSVDDKHWWERDLSTLSETRALVNVEISKQAVDLLHVNPDQMPDLLNPFDRSLQVVSLGMIESNTDRLALIGGMKGVLANIKRIGDRAKPNIVTFTQLMLSVSPAEEEQVLEMMAVHDVEPDVDFFNQLIYKRVYREDYQSALAVKELIEERHLVPNIKTYGCLAKACRSQTDGNQLLADIEAANMWPNPLIMHSLVKNSGFNFPYKKYLMLQMKKLDVQASVSLIKIVEKHISIYKDILVEKELEGAEDQAVFESKFRDFMEFYRRWVREISLQKPEHPWKQFQLEEDTEPQSQKA